VNRQQTEFEQKAYIVLFGLSCFGLLLLFFCHLHCDVIALLFRIRLALLFLLGLPKTHRQKKNSNVRHLNSSTATKLEPNRNKNDNWVYWSCTFLRFSRNSLILSCIRGAGCAESERSDFGFFQPIFASSEYAMSHYVTLCQSILTLHTLHFITMATDPRMPERGSVSVFLVFGMLYQHMLFSLYL
jgi:hypothetical protein